MATSTKTLFPLMLVCLLALTQTGGVMATNNKQIREDYSGAATHEVCGVIVHESWEGTFQATIKDDFGDGSDELWIGVYHDHGVAIHTNPANGKTVTSEWNFIVHEANLVDIGGGYYEFTFSLTGQYIRLNGEPVDRGAFKVTDTHYLGDLSTASDNDYRVARTIHHIGGPHPGLGSGGGFCSQYLPLIT